MHLHKADLGRSGAQEMVETSVADFLKAITPSLPTPHFSSPDYRLRLHHFRVHDRSRIEG